MNSICRDIFRAIHEGKWLSIEYKNLNNNITKYWIGIKNIDLKQKKLMVEGLHLFQYTLGEYIIFIDSIVSAVIIDGSYCPINHQLVEDIRRNPRRFQSVFSHPVNLKILNYLADCNRLNATPYKCDYSLIQQLDEDTLAANDCRLNDAQFREIVNYFQKKASQKSMKQKIKQLCLNALSVNTKKGLYVLAYRKLELDVTGRTLRPDPLVTICWEYTIEGSKQSIRQFLDADDCCLLDDFDKNQELIKNRITQANPHGVDDLPYLIAIGMDSLVDLDHEYGAIINMYNAEEVTEPVKAFFGEFTKPYRRKEYPVTLLNKRVNLDQLLAINNAMKYPNAYIQGPPGTGKTNTIINTISTAFFNEKTVLFVSYNNHPIDGVADTFRKLKYRDKVIPFPMLRLGNIDKIGESLDFIKEIYEQTKSISVFDKTLEKNRDDKIERTKTLTKLLKKHENILALKERKDAIEKLLSSYHQLTFQTDLSGRQLHEINKLLENNREVTNEEAMNLLEDHSDEFLKYLYYTSAKYIKRIDEPKNEDLLSIINMSDRELQVSSFNKYLSNDENFRKFLRIFPIVATTCISSHKLGEPKQYFDMIVMDEASQCNIAVALVPIIRGKKLMLVGDPQQLNPVILLNEKDNAALKQKYAVTDEYDFISNSIYKAYLASDAVSEEILLSHHYRCHRKIIEFNNKKYYNEKLNIESNVDSAKPLVFIDVEDNKTNCKNTSPLEAELIIQYIKKHKDKKIGVITPFANQSKLINDLLIANELTEVNCGTVHAFQGDEKDIILFSLAITEQTGEGTYSWLKCNKELINVATSRAKDQLILFSSVKNLDRLHVNDSDDDLYELVEYMKSNGTSAVTGKTAASRALGVKPYSTETEEAFLQSLNHALDNILYNNKKCIVYKEVAISHVFQDNHFTLAVLILLYMKEPMIERSYRF